MKAGELFIEILVKGGKESKDSVVGVKAALSETADAGLAAKASILGAVYAIEEFTRKSANRGTELYNFNKLTGESAQTLQKWEVAAMNAGGSMEEMGSTVRNVMAALEQQRTGKGPIQGLANIWREIGIDPATLDPDSPGSVWKIMDKLKDYSRSAVGRNFGNQNLGGLVPDGVISSLRDDRFDPAKVSNNDIYSEKQERNLDKANIAWKKLFYSWEMKWGKFNAAHGLQMITDIGKISGAVLELATNLEHLGEKLKIFQALSEVAQGLAGAIKDFNGYSEGNRSFWGDQIDKNGKPVYGKPVLQGGLGNFLHMFGLTGDGAGGPSPAQKYMNASGNHGLVVPAPSGGGNSTVNHNSVKVTNNITGVEDAEEVGAINQRDVNNAFDTFHKKVHK